MTTKFDQMTDEELREFTKNADVRNWPRERAVAYLYRAETTYLGARGWTLLVGVPEPFHVKPGDNPAVDTRYTHDGAVALQKKRDYLFEQGWTESCLYDNAWNTPAHIEREDIREPGDTQQMVWATEKAYEIALKRPRP